MRVAVVRIPSGVEEDGFDERLAAAQMSFIGVDPEDIIVGENELGGQGSWGRWYVADNWIVLWHRTMRTGFDWPSMDPWASISTQERPSAALVENVRSALATHVDPAFSSAEVSVIPVV